MRLCEISGEPYITSEPVKLGFRFRYIMPGYQIRPEQRGYKKDGEFGTLVLEKDDDNSGYLWVAGAGIDKEMAKKGYGRNLYRHALVEIKKLGYRGISSHRPSRTPAADALWSGLGGRNSGEYDLLDVEE